jgi:hypothetical protein
MTAVKAERITFSSEGIELVGELRLPDTDGPQPAIALTGPITGRKSRSPASTPSYSLRLGASRSPSTTGASGKAADAASMRTARENWPT